MEIIEKHDGLGGHTARGYGQVQFIVGNLDAVEIDLGTPAFLSELQAYTYNDKQTDYSSLSDRVAYIAFPEHPPAEAQDTTETGAETDINTIHDEPDTKSE